MNEKITEQEKTIAKIFDKSVEALGIMTKSLCDAIKSTNADYMAGEADILTGRWF